MKKSFRNVLFLSLLLLSLCLALAIASSAAETEVDNIADFKTAVEGASAGDTVTVTAQLSVTSNTTVTAPAAVTVSFTGSTSVFSVTDASLTLSGPMSISATVPCVLTSGTTSAVTMSNGLSVTATCLVQVNATSTNTINISGTTYRVGGTATYCIGTPYSTSAANVTITLGDGNDIVSSQMIMHTSASGTSSCTISGGNYTATGNNALYFRTGGAVNNFTMTGGTVTQTGSNNLLAITGNTTNTVSISGGTLAVTPAKYAMWLAGTGADTTVSISGDAAISVTGAQVAIYAAAAGNEITIADTATITSGGIGIQLAVAGNSLEMTGGTITSASSGVKVTAGDTALTFSGTAAINANTALPAIHSDYTGPAETTITISGGAYYAKAHYTIYLSSSGGASWPHYTLNITGGTFTSASNGAIGSRWSSYTRGTISGGTFKTTKAGQAAVQVTDTSDCQLTVLGGTYISDTAAFSSTSKTAGVFNLYGGTYNAPLTATYTEGGHSITVGAPAAYEVPSGHNAVAALELPDNTLYKRDTSGLSITCTYNGTGTPTFTDDNLIYYVPYCVATKDAVDTPYATLKEAIEGAASGSTVTISRNVFIPYKLPTITKALTIAGSGVTIKGSYVADTEFFNIGTGGNVTIGAGITILHPVYRAVQFISTADGASLTINGATIKSETNTPIVVWGSNNTVTLTSGTVTTGTATGYYGVFLTGTGSNNTVNINGGTLYANQVAIYINAARSNDNVTVTGGSITAVNDDLIYQKAGAAGMTYSLANATLNTANKVLDLRGASKKITVTNCSVTAKIMFYTEASITPDSGAGIEISGTTFRNGALVAYCMEVTSGAANTSIVLGAGNDFVTSSMILRLQSTGTTNVTVNGGSYTTSYNNAFYLLNATTVNFTMTAGTITQSDSNTLLNLRASGTNNAVISGGTLNAAGAGKAIEFKNGSTANTLTLSGNATVTSTSGVAITDSATGAALALTIYDGVTVTSTAGKAISLSKANVTVYGGKITGSTAAVEVNENNTVNLNGGTFAVTDAEGVVFVANGGTLNENGGFVAKGGATYLTGEDYADASKIYTGDKIIKRDAGAQVRMIAESAGLRFISHVDADTVDFVESIADADSISYYTIIFPAAYVASLSGDVTPANIFATLSASSPKQYVVIEADDGLIEDGEGGYYIRTALINLKSYTRSFACVAYIQYTVNGNTVYQSTVFNSENDTRNVKTVAQVALDAYEAGTASFNATQLAILTDFAENDGPTPAAMLVMAPAPAIRKEYV